MTLGGGGEAWSQQVYYQQYHAMLKVLGLFAVAQSNRDRTIQPRHGWVQTYTFTALQIGVTCQPFRCCH
jgi:hypothetical protein